MPLVDDRPRQEPDPCTAVKREDCTAKHHHRVPAGMVHCGQPDVVPPLNHYERFYQEYPHLDPRRRENYAATDS